MYINVTNNFCNIILELGRKVVVVGHIDDGILHIEYVNKG